MPNKDITMMSDDEIMKMDASEITEQEENTKEPEDKEEEESAGSTNDTEDSTSTEDVEDEDSSSEEDNKEEDKDENEDADESEDKEQSSDESESVNEESNSNDDRKTSESETKESSINYEEFYNKIVKQPLKANGKTIQLRSPEEAIQLMQMGANYTKKMQAIAPYKKTLIMLENNGLLDEEKLSFLIDLDKRNPEAIKKLLKDANIDPMEIDTSEEPKYQSGRHRVSDEEAGFVSTLNDLKQESDGAQTINLLNSWDDKSKEMLWKDPTIMTAIHEQRHSGVFEVISAEVERRKALGQIPAEVPFLQAYHAVGHDMLRQKQQEVQQKVTKVVKRKAPIVSNNEKARAAASTRTSQKQPKKFVNPLAMSDDEFLKQMENRL